MKNLVIVESPSKSKTIEKYLGKDFEVVSSKGHIRDLAIKGKDGLGVDVENDFTPTYSVSKDKKDVVKDLKARAKKVDQVYLATDPDREGEAISWHLAQVLGLDVDDINRVVFNEITKDAVLGAFDHPRTINMGLVKSQETRRILDRIIGFKLSKLLKNKIKSKSAGRVQSVALKLIVDREKEIKAFIPEEYWTLDAVFNKEGKEFNASLSKISGKKAELKNEADAKKAYEACLGEFEVTNVKKQVRKKDPKLPFITSTLQQEASTKLGFSAKRTMSIAQRLYEGIELKNSTEGLITYMRTDSTRLSDVFVKAANEKIQEEFGKEYLGNYKVKNDENSQDAHEGIRPTNIANTPEEVKDYLSAEQYKLYKMIYARALASLMAPAKTNTVAVTLSQNKYDFTANGTQLAFDGYLAVYSAYESSKDVLLPELDESEKMPAKELKSNQHFTEPPLRYSEARLIKQMEEEGIGRPSTYSMIIDTIQVRGYVSLDKSTETSKTKVFFPTEQGELTTEKLDQYFNDIINVKYTAQMENELDGIADGVTDNVKSLRDFYERFEPLVSHAYDNMEKMEPEKVGEVCPECGNELVYRVGRFGKFISCSTFPECKYTRKMEQPEKEKPEPSGKMCPDCGAELLKRKSRYGNYFLGCSNFPKCKHIENIEGEEAPKFKRRKAAKK
ncbi:type I DNA topoisomerase [Anaerorhabdus sp.]|uniref:type I DNA topoisomerase n=1 Tax=Anaerorhabdus sp. TaxID=1872524 RepID=UPI002FC86179